jgi:hypothetical protein
MKCIVTKHAVVIPEREWRLHFELQLTLGFENMFKPSNT